MTGHEMSDADTYDRLTGHTTLTHDTQQEDGDADRPET